MAMPLHKWLIPLIVVAVVAGVALALYFYFFGTVASAAELIPEGNMIYVRVSLKSTETGADQMEWGDLGQSFWQSFANQNPFFSYDDDVKPWIGDEVVLAKASPDLLDPFVVLAKVGNKAEALKTVQRLKDKMGDLGGAVTTERYKGVEIYSLSGQMSLAGGYLKGYLVLSTSLTSVKKIIDAGSGDVPALAQSSEFKNLKKNLMSPSPWMFVSLRLKEVLDATTSTLGTTERLLVKRFDMPDQLLLGIALTKSGKDLRVRSYLGLGSIASWGKVEQSLAQTVPQDLIAFYEGKDLAKQILELGSDSLSLNPEALSWATGEYAIAWLPGEGQKRSSFGLIMKIDNNDVVRSKMQALEPLLIDALGRWGVKGASEFKDGETNGQASRYASFTEGVAMDVNYTVLNGYLVFATSQESLGKITDVIQGNRLALQDSPAFGQTMKAVSAGETVALLYFNSANLIDWQASSYPSADESETNTDFLNQVLGPYEGLGLAVKQAPSGAILSDIFLPAK